MSWKEFAVVLVTFRNELERVMSVLEIVGGELDSV